MRTLFLKVTGSLIIVLLCACNFPKPGQTISGTAPTEETMEPAQDSTSGECAFMWANEPLPVLSDELDQALDDAPLTAEGYAQAYGENCVTIEGIVARFLAMETDFYITVQVEDLENKQALGELIEQIMGVLAGFPTDETPGPQPGYVGITFESSKNSLNLWVKRTDIESALENGLRGQELFDSLHTK